MKRGSAWLIVLTVLGGVGYPASYAALRLSHVMVHYAVFVSAEGLDAHTIHGVEGGPGVLHRIYAPFIHVEIELHRLWRR